MVGLACCAGRRVREDGLLLSGCDGANKQLSAGGVARQGQALLLLLLLLLLLILIYQASLQGSQRRTLRLGLPNCTPTHKRRGRVLLLLLLQLLLQCLGYAREQGAGRRLWRCGVPCCVCACVRGDGLQGGYCRAHGGGSGRQGRQGTNRGGMGGVQLCGRACV